VIERVCSGGREELVEHTGLDVADEDFEPLDAHLDPLAEVVGDDDPAGGQAARCRLAGRCG
jgi:hypothetical protein